MEKPWGGGGLQAESLSPPVCAGAVAFQLLSAGSCVGEGVAYGSASRRLSGRAKPVVCVRLQFPCLLLMGVESSMPATHTQSTAAFSGPQTTMAAAEWGRFNTSTSSGALFNPFHFQSNFSADYLYEVLSKS